MTEVYSIKYAMACAIMMFFLLYLLNMWYDKKKIEFNQFMEYGFIAIMASLTFSMIINVMYIMFLVITTTFSETNP